MGNPALADPTEIFEIENYGNPEWGINRGAAMELDCNYLLMCDKLLDPTHMAWVHQSSFARTQPKTLHCGSKRPTTVSSCTAG